MSHGAKPSVAQIQDELMQALQLMHETPAGDVLDCAYDKALARAVRRLNDKTKPFQIRPPRA